MKFSKVSRIHLLRHIASVAKKNRGKKSHKSKIIYYNSALVSILQNNKCGRYLFFESSKTAYVQQVVFA